MNTDQILQQLFASGDTLSTLKTVILPALIAVLGHMALNYWKSIKAGSLKKLHDVLAAKHIELTQSTLAEIAEAQKKAEAVVVDSATSALNKVLEDFHAKASIAQTVKDAEHEAVKTLLSDVKEQLAILVTNKKVEPTESNMHLSRPAGQPEYMIGTPFSRHILTQYPFGLSDVQVTCDNDKTEMQGTGAPYMPDTNLPTSGFLALAGSSTTSFVVGSGVASLSGITSSVVDAARVHEFPGVAMSYTGQAVGISQNSEGVMNAGSEKSAESIQSMVPGTDSGATDVTTEGAKDA